MRTKQKQAQKPIVQAKPAPQSRSSSETMGDTLEMIEAPVHHVERQKAVLQLQQNYGNSAVRQAIQRSQSPIHSLGQPIQRTPLSSPHHSVIQREEGAPVGLVAGNQYEFKVEGPLAGERGSVSLRFTVTRAKDKADVKVGETKISSTKKAGKSVAHAMSLTAAKGDIGEWSPVAGLKFKADMAVLDTKLENGDVDVDMLKFGVSVEGNLTKAIAGTELGDAIMATEFGEALMEGAEIKVTGKLEIKIDPSDAMRIKRMLEVNRQIADNAVEATKIKNKADALNRDTQKIRQHLKRKNLSKHAKKDLQKRLASNQKKAAELAKKLKTNKAATKALQEAGEAAAKGLKSKAGRTVGIAVKKAGGKLLAKLIPGLNLIMLAYDIYEISSTLYTLLSSDGEIQFGWNEGGEGAEGTNGDGGSGGAGGTSAGASTGAGGAGGTSTQGDGGSSEIDSELGAEINIDENIEFDPEGSKDAKPPELHAAASAVLNTIKTSDKTGLKFTNEDMKQLNSIVPSDLDSEKLEELLKAIRDKKGGSSKDIFDVLGTIQQTINTINNPEPMTTIESSEGIDVLQGAIDQSEAQALKEANERDAQAEERNEGIIRFIAEAEGQMSANGLNTYAVITPIPMKDVKKGTTVSGMIAFITKDGVMAGYATMIVLEKINGGQQLKIQRPNVPVYDSNGNHRGYIAGQSIIMNSMNPTK